MNFKDTALSDLEGIVFNLDEFAETVTYKQNGVENTVKVIFMANDIDNEDGNTAVDSTITVFMSNSYRIEPKPHDLIDNKWEVWQRKYDGGIWILTCYENERIKP